jgi:dTDP-4-amino-4,6-dideoxygalactose transaminase
VCPAYTFFATAGCVSRLGATPVFVDVLPCCLNLDPRSLERALTPRTKAIVPVHLFGQCCDMDAILEIARRHDVPVVEDAAQSLSARFQSRTGGTRAAGTLGAIGCYSFFPTKNLGALGDAGLITAEDDALAERLRILRVHGAKPKYYHHVIGGNFRIDALQAAFLRVKLPRLAAYTEARRKNAASYRQYFLEKGLADEVPRCGSIEGKRPLLLPSTCQPGTIWNQFVLRVRGEGKRDLLQKHLLARGIGTEVYYPVPLHLQECFRAQGGQVGSFPASELAARETIALPIFPELTPLEVRAVCEATGAFFSG